MLVLRIGCGEYSYLFDLRINLFGPQITITAVSTMRPKKYIERIGMEVSPKRDATGKMVKNVKSIIAWNT